jgi:hypothetical protein
MDIPVLLGFRIIKGKAFDLHVVAGPVFSSISSEEVNGDNLADKTAFEGGSPPTILRTTCLTSVSTITGLGPIVKI